MHSLFIIHKSIRDWFNAQAEAMGNDGIACAEPCLSVSGTEPGTHCWCAVQLSAEQEAGVKAVLDANPSEAVKTDWTRYEIGTEPDRPNRRLGELELKLIQPKLFGKP